MQVTVPSFAKLNLDLRVLHKRSDGYHELRTIFQTISLKDTLAIEYTPARRTTIELDSSIDIPDNLVIRAAHLVLESLKVRAAIRFKLNKKIPMGAGLGGGSSNAAAVITALPALAGKPLTYNQLVDITESLGSDITFFLLGGTALALGRGTEVYPLPDLPVHHAVLVSTGVHVSTALAYKSLDRDVTNALTSTATFPILREFQAISWTLESAPLGTLPLKNDFQDVVFQMHPELGASARKLRRLGAQPALMTGSGSAIFGVFESAAAARAASKAFSKGQAFATRFLNRARFRNSWSRALGPAAEVISLA